MPLVIVRDPYARLLSGYLDKVVGLGGGGWRAKLSFKPRDKNDLLMDANS